MNLTERWQALCQRLHLSQRVEETGASLQTAYAESGRFYHSLAHLTDCLTQLDDCRHLVPTPDEVEFALWFHDAIYDTHAADNERQSADWAMRMLQANDVEKHSIEHVEQLIMATCHDAVPADDAARYLVDIDLSILGRAPETFWQYEANVRQEYQWVSAAAFRAGRRKVLQGFLQRERIYQTAWFFERYEDSAWRNLTASLEKLQD